jgi:Ni,Fe-hydrogenase III small subunit
MKKFRFILAWRSRNQRGFFPQRREGAEKCGGKKSSQNWTILRVCIGMVGLCVLSGRLSFAQAPAPAQGFDAYRIVVQRNIFDPERQPIATGGAVQARVVEPPPKASDYIILTGVMVDNGKALAFFSGSQPAYDKVTEVNGDIAGAKVTKIAPGGIEVARAGRKIVVAVGQTVPFDDSAPGAPPADATLASAAAPAMTGTTGAADLPPATPPLPGNLTEVMRRMMERREHELQ